MIFFIFGIVAIGVAIGLWMSDEYKECSCYSGCCILC